MQTEQPTMSKCFVPLQKKHARKTSLSSKAVIIFLVLCCLFWCKSVGEVSPYVCSYYF